ncbi:MAG: hypothetical protein QOJ94_2496, partial [Sphingomonadales bacterium]|nr:hypothetical protein [Sphingomonadales bacterium]
GSATMSRRFLHADERGSIVAVTDSAGKTLGINRYDEHGAPAPQNIGRFQYTGQKWLSEAGLYDYKARFYDSVAGRFLQPDPIGYDNGPNLYAYVSGDPVNLVDPLGQCDVGDLKILIPAPAESDGNGGVIITAHFACVKVFGGYHADPGWSLRGPTPPAPPKPKKPICTSSPMTTAGAARKVGQTLAWAGDIGATVFGIAAVATSETGVGAVVFGTLALGSKALAAGGNALEFAGAMSQGDYRGAASAAAGAVAGPLASRASKGLRALEKVGSRYGREADEVAGRAAGRYVSAVVCIH